MSEGLPIRAASQEAFDRALRDLLSAATGFPELGAFLQSDTPARQLLLAAMTLSPYLNDIARTHPADVLRTMRSRPETLMQELVTDARDAWKQYPAEAGLMTRLRQLKRQMAFSLALYDLARVFQTPRITGWLSTFARAAVCAATDHLLLSAHKAGKLSLKDVEEPSKGSGLAIIGMGKLGSGELNYSSDIDLVVLYDPQAEIVTDEDEGTEVFSRLVRKLIRILQERTGDGYVFRTDLRLRPDPGSTPLALPYDAAMHYYGARGQNWERAAYIKASPAAGDMVTGKSYCRDLAPFVYRKYLDYGAIADIHSIKRQIHAHKGYGEIRVRGHNVKLGRGGIREIEFFVQTQQLIAGGRMPWLRTRQTDETLAALAEARWIDPEAEEVLRKAYWFLRDVEHRIQMRRDEQSHILPEDEEEFRQVSLMMGYDRPEEFSSQLLETWALVEDHYAQLFENESVLASEAGNLVFTGDGDDPDTISTLAKMGFERPSDMSRIIRTWHYGRYRATQTSSARERLTELMPVLLQAFSDTKRADETLLRFDAFLSGLPAGIQLFSMLGNNPGLLSVLINIMASAPRLAEVISRKPHVFDGMLDPALLAELPDRANLAERLEAFLVGDFAYEEILDRLRIFAAEQKFLIGVRLLTGAIDAERAGRAYTYLADLAVQAATQAVQGEMEQAHGRVCGGRVAIVGLGKLGSLEMTAESDVDLILLYTHDADCVQSDGARPVDPVRYYTRFTQRLIAALSAPMAEGILYEVDFRLRPSGNKGPVATHIRAFRKYQMEQAWSWEHMALTRARVVAGDPWLKAEAEEVFDTVLGRKRDIAALADEVAAMRQRIEVEKPPANIWDLKLIPGGIIDIEFIAQFMRLQAPAMELPVGDCNTLTKGVIECFGAKMIGEGDTETLLEALALYTRISQITRLCLDGKFDPQKSPKAFVDLMLRRVDFPDLSTLEAHLELISGSVREILERTLRHKEQVSS